MTASPIWVKTEYPEGEFIDFSKAFSIRIIHSTKPCDAEKPWQIKAEYMAVVLGESIVDKTVKSFKEREDANMYLTNIMKIFPSALQLKECEVGEDK